VKAVLKRTAFYVFRTWLELMQLRINNEYAVVNLARKKLLYVASFFNTMKHFNYSKKKMLAKDHRVGNIKGQVQPMTDGVRRC